MFNAYHSRESNQRGATSIASRMTAPARQAVVSLLEENPGKSKETLFEKFRAMLEDDPAMQEAVDWYFFSNMLVYATNARSASGAKAPADADVHEKAARATAVREKVESIKNQIALLHLTMPNGKAMRYCTGTEMSAFGKGYAKVAKRCGAKPVGEVLNEDEVRSLMQAK